MAFVIVLASLVIAQQALPTKTVSRNLATAALDPLGPHEIGGRGCAGCHPPRTGVPAGETPPEENLDDGSLWGQNLTPLYGFTLNFGTGGKYQVTLPPPSTFAATDNEIRGIMICLSCHDGNIAKGTMMTNTSWEQSQGLLPPNVYGPVLIPTLLGSDGSRLGNYQNDHPVGPLANLGALGIANRFSVTTCGSTPLQFPCLRTADAEYLEFTANYGGFQLLPGDRSLIAIPEGETTSERAYVVCTTCHTPHSMYMFQAGSAPGERVGLGQDGFDTNGVYATYFFIRAPYNPGGMSPAISEATSATQFCRGCHFADGAGANEASGIHGVTTQY